MQNKPRLKDWPEKIGLELEEALAILHFLRDMDTTTTNYDPEIRGLEDLIASKEIEKILSEEE